MLAGGEEPHSPHRGRPPARPHGRIGELPAPEPKQSPGTRADLAARIETAVNLLGKSRGDKKVTKIALVDQVLAVLDPR